MSFLDVFSLAGRTALVTGAGSGIGAAVASAFAGAGAAVLVTDVDGSAAQAVAKGIVAAGGTAEHHLLDVRDRAAADAAAAHAARLGGGTVHVLVNNAGAIAPAMFGKLEPDAFRRIVEIHLMGAFSCSQAVLPYLPEDGTGRILNVTSVAGLVGTIGQANYGAAKAGIIGLTKSLARELGRRYRQRAGPARRDADDPGRPQQREARREDAGTDPARALGRARRDRRELRVPRLRRRLLHHPARSSRSTAGR